MKKLLAIPVFLYIAYLVFTTSCANPGMPTGGDKDSIPPVVLKTVPEMNVTNYKGHTVSLTFNEFVISDEVSTKLIVSPPLKKKPTVRTKSKTLTVELGDSLMKNVTYVLDFRDAIADNNEKNPLENFRFAFSTGPQFDSLMVGGYVLHAANLEPVEEAMVLLYDGTDSLSAFREKIPKYIAKTDEEGFYALTNIAPGKYRLFALEDADNSLTYNQTGERIAFFDSLVVPTDPDISGAVNLDSFHFAELPDSLKTEADTIAAKERSIAGKVDINRLHSSEIIIPSGLDADSLMPDRQAKETTIAPHYLLLFAEKTFEQFLDEYNRAQRNLIKFYFSNSVTDSFRVDLISPQPSLADWSYLEFNSTRDSISLWIKDTLVSNTDTLMLQLKYETIDKLGAQITELDTLDLVYTEPVQRGRKKKAKEDELPVVQTFSFRISAKDGFDPYNPVVIESPEPLEAFDYSKVHLYQMVDTLEELISFDIAQDSVIKRKFEIRHNWEFEGAYRLEIDSAAARNFAGEPSMPANQKFKIQKEAFYGRIFMDIKRVPGNCIVQLLKNTEEEEVLKQIMIKGDGITEFPFLKPEKYKVRLIVDRNQNGLWDTGDLDEWRQPERVVYYSKILKIRSNFEVHENWLLPDDLHVKKELIDEDQKANEKKGKKGSKPTGRNLR